MLCPSCDGENSESAKFCCECGAQLRIACGACQSVSLVGKKFCADCGTSLQETAPPAETPDKRISASGERRQITVLFCDIVGYTQLTSSIDAEQLQQIVNTYEHICTEHVTRFDGFVYQRVGDGIVAFFGYPRAFEAEAERAILAGRHILEALAEKEIEAVGRLQVRIGIATGVVVTSGTEVAAYGETMNLAARLQGVAEPGSIAISEQVHKLAGGAFEYADLGYIALKGIPEKVRVYRVAGQGAAASRFDAAAGERLTDLVGRESEVELLKARWHQASEGEGHTVLLSGEPGIGKSRIISALRNTVEQGGAHSMRFQCSPFYTSTAYYPSIENFERTFAFGRDETPASKLDKLEAVLVNQYELPREDIRYVATLLSIAHEDRYGQHSMTPQKFKEETIRTLVDITSAAARRSQSVLFFEDAHWADATTLEVLDALIDKVADLPLLIVITFRPEFIEHWSDRGEVDLLSLSKLSRKQSESVIRGIAGDKDLPSGLVEQIMERAEGIPLYVEQLTRAVLESDYLRDLGDRYEYSGTARLLDVPATLRDSLIARLDRLPMVKEIAQIGAAIGRSFPYSLIRAVSPYPEDTMNTALRSLTDSGLARARGEPPETTYFFKHALIQDAAYDSLLKSDRKLLHAKLALAIEATESDSGRAEPELLAHHYSYAGDAEAAIPLWQQAAERELTRMSYSEAILHLGRALELIPDLPESPDRDRQELGLRSMQGVAWMAVKGFPAPEARQCFLPALKLVGTAKTAKEALPVYWGLWSNTLSGGRVASSARRAEEFLDRGRQVSDSDLIIMGHLMMCVSSFWLGNLSQCCEHAEAVREQYDPVQHRYLADEVNHDPLTGAMIYEAQATWMLGYPDRAVDMCKAMDAHARERNHVFDLGFSMATGSDVFQYRREPDIQLQRAEACEEIGRQNSLAVLWKVIGPLRRGAAMIRQGDLAQGTKLLREGLVIREAGGGYGGSNPYFKGLLAEGLVLDGDLSTAMQIIEDQIKQMERPNWEERCHYAETLRLKGWVHSLRNEPQAAEQSYLASLEHSRAQQAKSWELRTANSLASLWQQQGKIKEALQLVDSIQGWFSEGTHSEDIKVARALMVELSA